MVFILLGTSKMCNSGIQLNLAIGFYVNKMHKTNSTKFIVYEKTMKTL